MASVLHPLGRDDAQLARRVSAGDSAAFAVLDERHRGALLRYAGSLLRRSEHDAEDVVQDVLIRAHDALRAGSIPDELRPWLYRLTRNRAIDEVRRKRWGEDSLDSDHAFIAHDGREEPEAALGRKESMRRLVEDLAALPVRQREALLARELDGLGPEQVAAQLGVTVAAAQKLAMRARENLVKTRDARDADCDLIRAVLLDAYERGVRSTEHALRHVKGCDACRAYQRDVRRLSRQLHGLSPSLGIPLVGGLAKLLGVGSGTAAGVAAASLVLAASGGIVVLDADLHHAGQRIWFKLVSTDPDSDRGYVVPKGKAVVTAHIRVPAGAPADERPRSVTLACPKGMKLRGLVVPPSRRRSALSLSAGSVPGWSTRARLDFISGPAPPGYDSTVGIECKKPHPSGSLEDKPRLAQPGERAGHICANNTGLYRPPPGPVDRLLALQTIPLAMYRSLTRPAWYRYMMRSGRLPRRHRPHEYVKLYKGQPIAMMPRRDATGRWTRIIDDHGFSGWVMTRALCR